MTDEALLTSQYVLPKKLIEAGFEFKYTALSVALKKLLK